jgi:hypothetical protein
LILLVFFAGLFQRTDDRRRVGILAVVGLTVLLDLWWRMETGQAEPVGARHWHDERPARHRDAALGRAGVPWRQSDQSRGVVLARTKSKTA